MKHDHTLSIIVRNQPGVLTKIASMFYRHDYNIESLTVGKLNAPGLSKIVISVPTDDRDVELLRRLIENLVDVKSARLLDGAQTLRIEACLVDLACDQEGERERILGVVRDFAPRVLREEKGSLALEIADHPQRIDDFLKALETFRILDISRTGMTSLGPVLPPAERNV